MQKVLWPNQAAVTHSREPQSSHHTQDTLTPAPAQHHDRQKQHRCCLDGRQGDGCGEFRSRQVEEHRCGQKERQEREKQGTGLLQREEGGIIKKDIIKKELVLTIPVKNIGGKIRRVPCFSFGAYHRHVSPGCPLSQHGPGSNSWLQMDLSSSVFLCFCLCPSTAWCPCKCGSILEALVLFRISAASAGLWTDNQ